MFKNITEQPSSNAPFAVNVICVSGSGFFSVRTITSYPPGYGLTERTFSPGGKFFINVFKVKHCSPFHEHFKKSRSRRCK